MEEEANSEPKEEDGDLIFQGTGKNRRVWVVEIGLVENFMPSDDLNEVVESLLHKRAKTFGDNEMEESGESGSPEKGRKRLHRQAFGDESGLLKPPKRFRKNLSQNALLLQEFEGNPTWSKQKIAELASSVGLKQSQIYKWNWDMQRKAKQDI